MVNKTERETQTMMADQDQTTGDSVTAKHYPSEIILADDYPVYVGYWYVVDGVPTQSEISGTVRQLRGQLNASEVRRCDLLARGMPRKFV